MRTHRKLLIGIGIAIAVLLAALILLPFAFRDRIEARLASQLSRSYDARVAWRRARLSVLRDFPNATLRLDEPTVVGVRAFATDTLVRMGELRLVVDLGSVWRNYRSGAPIVVREIALERPAVRLRVLTDGRANWDIARATGDTGGGALDVTLRELRISGGTLTLDDQEARLEASLAGLAGALRGDFARERFRLEARTRVDTASLEFGGVPYLSRAAVALDADVDADLPAHRYTLAGVTLRLNRLALSLAGTVTAAGAHPALDLTFSSPSTAFRDILSLVPALYRRDFERLRTAGRMSVSGRVRGMVKPDTLPAFALRARVENGAFQYPSLPLPARDIFLDLALDNPGGVADATVTTIERLRATVGGRPLAGRLVLRTPVTDPDVDLRLVGSLDLADLARTVKLEGVTSIAGLVSADVLMRARLSDVDARRYDRVDARGTVHATRVAVRASALPQALAIDTVALRLTPRAAELGTLAGRIGGSDVQASGSLDNVLGFALRGDELRGRATVRSRRFDLMELVPKQRSAGVLLVPPHVDFALDAAADRVDYGAIVATDVRGDLRVKDRRVTLDSIRMQMLRGTVVANGFYETQNPARPTFDATLRLAEVDVPSAFGAMQTVQRLAPIARRAQGTIGGTFALAGTMDSAMVPVFTELDGRGALDAARLGLQGSRVFGRLADALSIEQLRSPSLEALRFSYALADGRVTVQPFTVGVAGVQLTVGGSHGVDGTLGYDLQLAVPRALVDGATRGAVTRLAARAGKAGIDLGAGEGVRLAARVSGTFADPAVAVSFAGIATSLREAARDAVRQQIETRAAAVRERVDSAAEEGRRRARAEAERAIAAAEAEAAQMRERAHAAADTLRRRAGERADSLVARTANPLARGAAQLAADRLKREADQQADRLLRAASARADSLVARARLRADSLTSP